MARPKSDRPAYCKHKRTGRAFVTIDGHQRTLPGDYGSEESRAAYDRLVGTWMANGRALPAAPAAPASSFELHPVTATRATAHAAATINRLMMFSPDSRTLNPGWEYFRPTPESRS